MGKKKLVKSELLGIWYIASIKQDGTMGVREEVPINTLKQIANDFSKEEIIEKEKEISRLKSFINPKCKSCKNTNSDKCKDQCPNWEKSYVLDERDKKIKELEQYRLNMEKSAISINKQLKSDRKLIEDLRNIQNETTKENQKLKNQIKTLQKEIEEYKKKISE